AVGLVVGVLDRAAALGLGAGALHARGDGVGVHQNNAVRVAGRAADRLDQTRLAAQETLFVGVQNRDQRNLGQVQALAQQVDADDRVDCAGAQVLDGLHPLKGIARVVPILGLDAVVLEVVGQVFSHL